MMENARDEFFTVGILSLLANWLDEVEGRRLKVRPSPS